MTARPRHESDWTTSYRAARKWRALLRTSGLGLLALSPTQCAPSTSRSVSDGQDASIGVRNAHALAYDAARERLIVFGGADDRAVSGETWSWDGRHWRRLAVTGPLPRTFPAIASDAFGKSVFLYGGHRALFGNGREQDSVLADFWRWDGTRWSPLGADGPGARAEAALAYDEARHRLVLFGGYRGAGRDRVRLGDTWEWDGSTWSLASRTGPTARNNAAMVYDPDRSVTVLFGGSDGSASGETWEWNGRGWRSAAPTVEPRYNPVMTYDPVRRRILRFGGWDGKARHGDTWTFDGQAWASLGADGPAPRNHSALAFDLRRRRAVLFGGHDGARVFGDVWEWNGSQWLLADSVASQSRIENGH